jgi:hypothetical protein
MILPSEALALAEARGKAFEEEMRRQRLLARLPKQPAVWQELTGSGLMWVGTHMVSWGEGMRMPQGTHRVEMRA